MRKATCAHIRADEETKGKLSEAGNWAVSNCIVRIIKQEAEKGKRGDVSLLVCCGGVKSL